MSDNELPLKDLTTSEDQPRKPVHPFLRGLIASFVAVPVLTTVVAFAGRFHWLLDLLSHFRAHYILLLVLGLVIAMLARMPRTAAVATLAAFANMYFVAGVFTPVTNPAVDANAPSLTVIHFNINSRNPQMPNVIDWLSKQEADVIGLQEVTAATLEKLEQLVQTDFPYRIAAVQSRQDAFGIALLVHQDIETANEQIFSPADPDTTVPAIDLIVRKPQLPDVQLIYIHTLPPVSSQYTRVRNKMLSQVAGRAASANQPVILFGDLNLTPWSTGFADFVESADLLNSQRGFGMQGTWPAGSMTAMHIPIDHLLHSDDLITLERQTGPATGSDHLPLIIKLAPTSQSN